MSKGKSVFVTGLMAVLTATVLVGSRVVFPILFDVVIGLLAGVGFVFGFWWFYRWICGKPEQMDVPEMICGEPVDLTDFTATYDEIKRGVMKDE